MDKTAVFSVRVDLKDIATLHNHYSRRGIDLEAVSTLTRYVIELVAHTVVYNLDAPEFDSTTDAVNYLESKGLMKPLRTRGGNVLIKQMQKESMDLDGIDPSYAKRKGIKTVSSDQIQAAKDILKQKQEANTSGAILGPTPGTTKEG